MSLHSSGYIVCGKFDGVICGFGPSADAAWDNFTGFMIDSGIKVRGEIDDAEIEMEHDADGSLEPDQTPANEYKIMAATAALLKAVEDRGGDISWKRVGVVGCLPEETN